MSSINMEKARNTFRPNVTFSHDVGGSQKVMRVRMESMQQGTIMLNK